MITNFKNKTAVLTGAGSGFGLECSRIGAKLGMNIVLVDVQKDALDHARIEISAVAAKYGGQVMSFCLDISKVAEVEAMGQAVFTKLDAPHFVFNNAGVGAGGLIWAKFSAIVFPVQVRTSPCSNPASSRCFITTGIPPTRSISVM